MAALACGDRRRHRDGHLPLLLAISDNGPQMRSRSAREFLAGVAIAQQFGRPGVPQDQGWIETLFGHIKGEWPHLEKIRDPGALEVELNRVRHDNNAVRFSPGVISVSYDVAPKPDGEASATHLLGVVLVVVAAFGAQPPRTGSFVQHLLRSEP